VPHGAAARARIHRGRETTAGQAEDGNASERGQTTSTGEGPATDGQSLEELSIDTIRMLSIDAVQRADSGHPGLPLGAAAMAYALWTRFLRHNPRDPC